MKLKPKNRIITGFMRVKINTIISVLEELPFPEYYIVSKKLE